MLPSDLWLLQSVFALIKHSLTSHEMLSLKGIDRQVVHFIDRLPLPAFSIEVWPPFLRGLGPCSKLLLVFQFPGIFVFQFDDLRAFRAFIVIQLKPT